MVPSGSSRRQTQACVMTAELGVALCPFETTNDAGTSALVPKCWALHVDPLAAMSNPGGCVRWRA